MLEEDLPAEEERWMQQIHICFTRDDGVNLSIALPHRLSTLLQYISSMAGDAVSEVRASPQPRAKTNQHRCRLTGGSVDRQGHSLLRCTRRLIMHRRGVCSLQIGLTCVSVQGLVLPLLPLFHGRVLYSSRFLTLSDYSHHCLLSHPTPPL